MNAIDHHSYHFKGLRQLDCHNLKLCMFLVPNLTPKTLEDLISKPDEEVRLAKKEAELKGKVLTSCLSASFTLLYIKTPSTISVTGPQKRLRLENHLPDC